MRKYFASFMALVLMTALFSAYITAQVADPSATRTQGSAALYSTVAISSTAAVNNQVTLTIPTPPPGMYNYVCFLGYHASQDGTATAQTNAVTTSTNFNSFAIKYSLTATATINYDRVYNWGTPSTGCVKSTSPGTSTTFVSPAAAANLAFQWDAVYFQAP